MNNQRTDEMREALRLLIIERAHWNSADEMVNFIIRECAPILATRYQDALREMREYLLKDFPVYMRDVSDKQRLLTTINKLLGEKP